MISKSFSIGFIGLGLIGGSIARTIRRIYPDSFIVGYDVDKKSVDAALSDRVLNESYDEIDERFSSCDIIFLCAPVSINIDNIRKLKEFIPTEVLITDVGSVKAPMQEAVKELGMEQQFIGGHPMVGSEKTSYAASSDYLLENAYYFITPSSFTQFRHTAMFSSFIQGLGALAVTLPPEEHDFITASLSHIPHIIAAELVHLVERGDSRNGMLKQLAAGGFKSMTRIASSSPVMWEQICQNNRTNIKKLLTEMIDDLSQVIDHLDDEDTSYIHEYFRSAGEYRNSVPEHAVGLFDKVHKIYIDIPDEPGTIANVTTQLAFNNISIKNLGIIYSRGEYEEGALEIEFYDDEACQKAIEVLENRNFRVFVQ
ncbi:MAG: prephenate dehydrogenase [Eubacterium sp.]|nr:prephenate dehydrogenase [Eubacterium sp.]